MNYSGSHATPRPDLGAAYEEFMDSPEVNRFVANEIAPVISTPVQAGNYSNITRETALQTADAKRASGGGYNRIAVGAEDKLFSTKEYGLEGVVDDRKRRLYQSDFDLELVTLRQTIRRLLIAREKRVAAMIFNTTTWTGSALYTDDSAAEPWDDPATDIISDVVEDTEKVRGGTGMEPNALLVSKKQLKNICKNTGVLALFPGAPIVTPKMVRDNLFQIFELEKLIVPGMVENTADEGLAATISDIWSDDYAMVCRVANPGDPIDTPCVARTWLWTPETPTELLVESYREEQVRALILRARHDLEEKVIDAAQGHLRKID